MPRRRSLALLFLPLTLACSGDLPGSGEEARADLAGEAGGAETSDRDPARRTGTLTVEGDPLSAPGDYELNTSCSYSRGNGSFSFGLHPDVDSQIEQGASAFGVRAGWGPRSSVPLEDGTYEAEFEYTELTGEGPILSWAGEGEMSIRIVDESRESFPVVAVEASGEGEGVRVHAEGVCQAMVMG
jgi:hypothetical protein